MEFSLFPYPQNVEIADARSIAGVSGFSDDAFGDDRLRRAVAPLLIGAGRTLTTRRNPGLVGFDAYRLDFSETAISLVARDAVGAFRGLTTLRQLAKIDSLPARGHIEDHADIAARIQHVDLKRLGWNFDCLLALFDLFADLKINYVLLEYEDKFPFAFCDDIAVADAFSREQVARLEQAASERFIQIAPLVQCLGHLEYALKRDKRAALRENVAIPSQACPSRPETFALFQSMAAEVMAAHPSSKYFHVGGDEPFLLGTCPTCAATAARVGKGKLYADYLNKVLSWVIDTGKKVPLFWADILEHYDDAATLCRKDAIAVEWNYSPTSLRSNSVKFYQSVTGRIAPEDYEKTLTEPQRAKYGRYLDYRPETRDFDAFPFAAFLRDQGFAVVGASCVNRVDNVISYARKVRDERLFGALATYWASADSLRPPYAAFENRLQGVCALGAAAWNADHEVRCRADFYSRVAAYLAGNRRHAPLYETLDVTEHLISPSDNDDAGDDYFARLDAALRIPDVPERTRVSRDFLEKIRLEKDLATFRRAAFAAPLFRREDHRPIDLAPYANRRFANLEDLPGWTGIYRNDLRFFPTGDVCFQGVAFHVNPDSPDRENSVVLVGNDSSRPYAPSHMENIRVGTAARALCFVHGHVEGHPTPEGLYGKYRLRYADGEEEIVPLLYRKNMGAWWRIVAIEEADIAWSGKNLRNVNVGLHFYPYFPRRPEKTIASLDFICESEGVMALAALTALPSGAQLTPAAASALRELDGYRARFSALKEKLARDLETRLSTAGAREVAEIAIGFTLNALDRAQRLAD